MNYETCFNKFNHNTRKTWDTTTQELLYDSQYGCRTEHSTEFAALELADRIITCMDHNDTPINIYLDLSKAFDTLDQKILLAKLQHCGIPGTSLELVKSYFNKM